MSKNIKKSLSFIIAIMFIFGALPFNAFALTPPEIYAESAILVETSSGKVLYEKDAQKRMYPASMTKILTAIVALDYFAPEALITVGGEINSVPWDSSKAGHVRGETLNIENLIRGLIIPSGNDSANVLSYAVVKKIKGDEAVSYEDSEAVFAELLNEKAKDIGAENTHFTNAHGYHDENHYTTASDMSKITMAALQIPLLAEVAREKGYSGNGAGSVLNLGDNVVTNNYNWTSHNLLLTEGDYYYEYATGFKTGFTDEAGSCLSATAEKDGKKLVAIVFNSQDPERWNDAKKLFEFGFNNFDNISICQENTVVDTVALNKHNREQGDELNIVVKETITKFMALEEAAKITSEMSYNSDISVTDNENGLIKLNAPIEEGQEIGKVTYYLDGNEIASTTLYSQKSVEKASLIDSIKYFAKDLAKKIFTVKGLIAAMVVVLVIIIIFTIIKRRKRPKYRYGGNYYRFDRKKFK